MVKNILGLEQRNKSMTKHELVTPERKAELEKKWESIIGSCIITDPAELRKIMDSIIESQEIPINNVERNN